jgi:hypothetical protein
MGNHFISILQETDCIMQSLPDKTSEDYTDAKQMRDMAFGEILKDGLPFIYPPDSDNVVITIDGKKYEISTADLLENIGQEDFDKVINTNKQFDDSKATASFTDFKEKVVNKINEEENRPKLDSPVKTAPTEDVQNNVNDSVVFQPKKTIRDSLVASVEIGFMGLNHGVGNTHNAIMMCSALTKNYNVCYIELDGSGHIADMAEWLMGQPAEELVSINNIDFFFGMNYNYFASHYKDSYDFIVIDFGAYDESSDLSMFLRTGIKFITVSGIDWNLPRLQRFYLKNDFATSPSIHYLIPFLTDKNLKPVGKILDENDYFGIPLNTNPFEPAESISTFFVKNLAAKEKKKKKIWPFK